MADREGRVCLVTTPDAETAERIVRALVDERLAACGNILPGITSIFRWQGAVDRTQESLVVLKTTADAAEPLTRRVAELHPYEVPEVLVLEVESGLAAYLDWMDACVGQPRGHRDE